MPPPEDPRERLAQLVVRLRAAPEAERPALVEQLLPLLARKRVPLAVRLAAAARAIESLPDTVHDIRGVVRAVTAGLRPSRALHRLRHLQHLTGKSDALDSVVTRRERKVKMGCPRCGVRLPRAEMAKHLWHAHGLSLVKGRTRGRAREVDAIRRQYAAAGDPALFDRAEEVGGEPALRAWAAETASEEESLPLGRAAGERGAGLCPACFAEVPPGAPELPPPLALAHGRLAGDGHEATAAGAFSPRAGATLAAAVVLVLVGGLVHFRIGLLLAAFAYGVTLVVRTPSASADERAVDAAWRKLAPRLLDRRAAARFLTRLCLTSVGRGDPMERADALNGLIARARDNPAERQLLAAAEALRVDDGARYGRDRAAGIAELVAPAFRGERPADFADAALGAYFRAPHDPAERGRLRVLLHAGAFAAGLTPRDLLDLCGAAPHVADAMRLPPHHLALLYGVWVDGTRHPWARVGEARTVFDLTANAPTTAGRLLAHEPGLLLACDTPPEVEAEWGPVLITAGGVSLGGMTVLDPAAEVRGTGRGRELIFGRHVLRPGRAVPAEFAEELKAWLRFRAKVVAAYPERYLRGVAPASPRLLAPFVARCPACGAECLPAVGAVGRALRW